LGIGPARYDETILCVSSLAAPAVAAHGLQTFAPALNSSAGRLALPVVASEFLQRMQGRNTLELEGPLCRQVALLLA